MTLITPKEAMAKAEAIQRIPKEVLDDLNADIIEAYANNNCHVIFTRPDSLSSAAWNKLEFIIGEKYLNVKSHSHQFSDDYISFELPKA